MWFNSAMDVFLSTDRDKKMNYDRLCNSILIGNTSSNAERMSDFGPICHVFLAPLLSWTQKQRRYNVAIVSDVKRGVRMASQCKRKPRNISHQQQMINNTRFTLRQEETYFECGFRPQYVSYTANPLYSLCFCIDARGSCSTASKDAFACFEGKAQNTHFALYI